MAKKSSEPKNPATDESSASDSVLVSAAKALGAAAGKVAAVTHIATPDTPAPGRHTVKGKYPKQNKSRLPRKEKKALAARSAVKG